ncbi:hypothetical protein EJ04DRAFT_558613 [Polyplosphaeria fusca]|uniref:Tyrosine specific protein phosphatases domain-containing protein n=1 Tax=Polyplosphaeria fusca TaxID=682080 RepID=A0A9P4RB00_9PLEO|nr:hypothetical protein EJ04DRAFT_558613 [Polyplosphaeria fusca]
MSTSPTQHELHKLVETDMLDVIPKSIVDDVLSKPPFTVVPGVVNIRDLGAFASPYVKHNLIYRSGTLSPPHPRSLPPASLSMLRDELGIKLILDMRNDREIAGAPDPVLQGVQNVHLRSTKPPTPTDMNAFLENGGIRGYVNMYEEILDIHTPSIQKALEWIRDEGTPLLFHCTSGKDRTGVLAAVILGLAGAPADVIAYDYSLSRVGVEPSREFLLAMLKSWNADWTLETPGIAKFSQVRKDFMMATLEMVDGKYGGMEGYVKSVLGFGDEDVERIRNNLREE